MDGSITRTGTPEYQPLWYEWTALPALGSLVAGQSATWTGFFRMGGAPTAGEAALLALRALVAVMVATLFLFMLRRPLARISRLIAWAEHGWSTPRTRTAFAELVGFGGALVTINAVRMAHLDTPQELLLNQLAAALLVVLGAGATAWMLRLMPASIVRSGRPAAGIGILVCLVATWGIGVGGWW